MEKSGFVRFCRIFARHTLAEAPTRVSGRVRTYIERRLLDALFLALRNFATFGHCQCKATVDVCGICVYICQVEVYPPVRGGYALLAVHIGVGFCVARSYSVGQCEGLLVRDE